jgi:hypothetical protein
VDAGQGSGALCHDVGKSLNLVVGVRRRQQGMQDQAVGVDEQVVFRPDLAAVGRIPAGQLAPLFARTEMLSTQPRDQR